MADIQRSADAVWQGNLQQGKGQISTPSGVLSNDSYTFATRFENAKGTNPEELIAAAHAACFSMAFANTLAKQGYQPDNITTHATLIMQQRDAGWTVTKIRLQAEGRVPGIDQAKFQQVAEDAGKNCPISRLLKPGLEDVEVVATLKQ